MVRRFLFPRYEDEFPAFRAEVERLSVLGLRVIAAICVGAPFVGLLLTVVVMPSPQSYSMLTPDAIEIVVGALILYVSFRGWIGRYARGFGIFTGALIASIQSAGVLVASASLESALRVRPVQFLPTILTGVLSVGIVAIPLKPVHTFGLGAVIVSLFTRGRAFVLESAGLEGAFRFPVRRRSS